MDHYVEFKLKPIFEFPIQVLMAEVYGCIHRSFCSNEKSNIGLSFPEFDKDLGSVIRLHSNEESLQKFLESSDLLNVKEYFISTGIIPVPLNSKHRFVSRVRVKSNPIRLMRRSVRKGWLTEEEAIEKLKKMELIKCFDPYIWVKSRSTNQKFRLFIKHGELLDNPKLGAFSNYGLSNDATVPWF